MRDQELQEILKNEIKSRHVHDSVTKKKRAASMESLWCTLWFHRPHISNHIMKHYNTSLRCNNSIPLVYTLFAKKKKKDRNCDKSDSRKSCLTYRGFFINGFDDKFLIVERNVPDLTPGEANFRCHPEKRGEEGSQFFFSFFLTEINVTFHNFSTWCQKLFLFVCFVLFLLL